VYGARRILKNAPMILQSFFSLPKVRVLELYFLQKPSRAMNGWQNGKSKKMEV
jgi:hypothetical protein